MAFIQSPTITTGLQHPNRLIGVPDTPYGNVDDPRTLKLIGLDAISFGLTGGLEGVGGILSMISKQAAKRQLADSIAMIRAQEMGFSGWAPRRTLYKLLTPEDKANIQYGSHILDFVPTKTLNKVKNIYFNKKLLERLNAAGLHNDLKKTIALHPEKFDLTTVFHEITHREFGEGLQSGLKERFASRIIKNITRKAQATKFKNPTTKRIITGYTKYYKKIPEEIIAETAGQKLSTRVFETKTPISHQQLTKEIKNTMKPVLSSLGKTAPKITKWAIKTSDQQMRREFGPQWAKQAGIESQIRKWIK